MPCSLGPLGIYPGHLSEGTWPMLLGYHDEREGQQQESVLTESQTETHSISTPGCLSSTQTCVTYAEKNELCFSFLSSFPVGYIFKYHTLCWTEFRFAFYRKGFKGIGMRRQQIVLPISPSDELIRYLTRSHSLPLAPVCRR